MATLGHKLISGQVSLEAAPWQRSARSLWAWDFGDVAGPGSIRRHGSKDLSDRNGGSSRLTTLGCTPREFQAERRKKQEQRDLRWGEAERRAFASFDWGTPHCQIQCLLCRVQSMYGKGNTALTICGEITEARCTVAFSFGSLAP